MSEGHTPPLLEMQRITKQFGAFTAIRDINLTLNRGETLTLLGENGAGKSTLMNVLCGLYRPTSGEIRMNGRQVKLTSPADAVRYGIGMVHQHFMLVEAFSVFQNIILGVTDDKAVVINEAKLRSEIMALSDRYGLDIEFDKKIKEISVGAQQRVEIIKTLWRGSEILILDEPTAVLTDEETVGLFGIIRRLTAEGKSVIFISHKMREVMEISDRIMVLRHGEVVSTVGRGEADETELAAMMVGHRLVEKKYPKVQFVADLPPVLSIQNASYHAFSKHNGLRGLSLTVGRGEIVGIAGVDGNGQSELARLVTGLIAPDSGEVVFRGKTVGLFSPCDFIARNISHVPEDRNKMGLIGAMSIRENLLLKSESSPEYAGLGGFYLRKKAISAHADQLREKYDVRCFSIDQPTGQLSGGNQQKVILARELERNPDLLIAVHPIRGLDIGAAQFIHDCIIAARDRGCGVLLISTDLNEILEVSDRIVVLFEGEATGVFSGENPPIEAIAVAMSGREKEMEGC